MNTEFAQPLLTLMRETFENSGSGFYLDANNSLMETLSAISAEQASIPVGGKCASLAAQVAHIIFFIEVFEDRVAGKDTPADWGHIWRTVREVTPDEWQTLQDNLRAAGERMIRLFDANPTWNADTMGGALSVLIHSAYHLGEIRQATCTLKQ